MPNDPQAGGASQKKLLELTADIVAAYVSNTVAAPEALPAIIADVYKALETANQDETARDLEPLIPAVPVTESLTDDYIICLEDGEHYKSLKRHIRTNHDLTPAEYREKWGLPKDYPMVAPNYAKERSALAKKSGLGRSGR